MAEMIAKHILTVKRFPGGKKLAREAMVKSVRPERLAERQ
jgi:hypothetical protein